MADIGDKNVESIRLEHIKRGDTDAFEYFFRAYVDPLYSYALGFLKDKAAAEDIVQEAYLYLWKSRARIDYSDNIYSYLQCAVKNACLNVRQHCQVEKKYEERAGRVEPGQAAPDWHDAEALRELRQRLLGAIDRLPEKNRRIFVMSAIEGFKYRDIAQKTGLTENTVKSHIKRSYQRLREDSSLSPEDLAILLAIMQVFVNH